MFENKHKEIIVCSLFSIVSDSEVLKATVCNPSSYVGVIVYIPVNRLCYCMMSQIKKIYLLFYASDSRH